MKYKIFFIPLIIIACNMNNVNEMLLQKVFNDTVEITELDDVEGIRLSWKKDNAADKYIIMKSYLTLSNQESKFIEIYSGKKEIYIDTDISDELTYIYRLDKEKNGVIFKGDDLAYYRYSRPEPFYDVVKIQNLNNGRSVYLTWEEDIGADEYRIMRALNDGSAIFFTERTHGVDGFYMQGATSAIDSALEDDKGYLYRLDKKRADIWIPGIEIVSFSRSRPMPYPQTPEISCFREDGYIHIKWQYDEGADKYLLARSFDNPLTSSLDPFIIVYEGIELEYLDKNVNSQTNERYVYKLYKERNGNIYQWDDRIALGVAVVTQEDKHEPNNIEAHATLLETFRIANIYCFGYSMPNTYLEDMDWYKVNIPPNKIANISIEYNNAANTGHFLLYIPYMETETIIHNVAFQIRNDDLVQKHISFAIIPDRTKFLLGNGTGGQVAGYTITWVNIESN